MVQRVVALLIAVVELLEAEADRLTTGIRRLLVTGALVAIGTTVVAAGLVGGSGFLMWSLYLTLLARMPAASAALIMGLGAWLLLGGVTWLAVLRLRRN
jgi:nitrate reductase NapE component